MVISLSHPHVPEILVHMYSKEYHLIFLLLLLQGVKYKSCVEFAVWTVVVADV